MVTAVWKRLGCVTNATAVTARMNSSMLSGDLCSASSSNRFFFNGDHCPTLATILCSHDKASGLALHAC